jgi:hypothetical protein
MPKQLPTIAPKHKLAFPTKLFRIAGPRRDHGEFVLPLVGVLVVEIADFNRADPSYVGHL